MENKRIAMVLYTQGLEYDDRIRKEILSITNACPYISFVIFAVTPQNKKEDGITKYGIEYHIPYLKSRDKYKSGTHTLAKAYDFYKTVAPQLKDFDAIWCADIETFLFPALLPKSKPIIWDLHELPTQFMGRKFMRFIFKQLTKKCKLMYHANQARIDCLNGMGMLDSKTPQIPIRNYPNSDLKKTTTPQFEKLTEFKNWLDGRKCIYVQGVSSMIRRPVESISAILETPDYCGVVVGGFPEEAKKIILENYPESKLQERIFFVGKVPQVQTKNFIKECRMGLVFYQTCSWNNIYCEPNRMFQTLMMERPVIVGNNPPMKELVDKCNVGISLHSDGSDIKEIVKAIRDIDLKYDWFRQNIGKALKHITWEGQEDLLVDSFRNAIN